MKTDNSQKISQLRNLIERGYGLTGKPIPQKRMKQLRKTLAELEATKLKITKVEIHIYKIN